MRGGSEPAALLLCAILLQCWGSRHFFLLLHELYVASLYLQYGIFLCAFSPSHLHTIQCLEIAQQSGVSGTGWGSPSSFGGSTI
jgi:hypothetical protein